VGGPQQGGFTGAGAIIVRPIPADASFGWPFSG